MDGDREETTKKDIPVVIIDAGKNCKKGRSREERRDSNKREVKWRDKREENEGINLGGR